MYTTEQFQFNQLVARALGLATEALPERALDVRRLLMMAHTAVKNVNIDGYMPSVLAHYTERLAKAINEFTGYDDPINDPEKIELTPEEWAMFDDTGFEEEETDELEFDQSEKNSPAGW